MSNLFTKSRSRDVFRVGAAYADVSLSVESAYG